MNLFSRSERRVLERRAYVQVADELASGNLVPWLMAKATADSFGDRNRAQSLYLRYRASAIVEEALANAEGQNSTAANAGRHAATRSSGMTKGDYECMSCNFIGRARRMPIGSTALMLFLLLLGLVPGILYGVFRCGYHTVCDKCGAIIDKELT